MTDELRHPIVVNLGTIRSPTLEAYEERHTTFVIDSVTFELRDEDNLVVASGTGTFDNTATNEAGATIQTVSAQIDFSESWAEVARYRLHFFITTDSATGGDSDVLATVVDVVEFRG